MKRNYKKQRKPRSTEYARSTRLLKQLGEEVLRQIFDKMGMYKASRKLTKVTGEFIAPWTA